MVGYSFVGGFFWRYFIHRYSRADTIRDGAPAGKWSSRRGFCV
jgi:hypothetical protein